MSNTHISNSKWKKGVYKPINPHKYKGGDAIIFRSRWEFRMMRFLDLNENVLEWISERPLIPYLNPVTQTTWNYHPDFVVKLKTQSGYVVQMLEVKPYKQTIAPKVTPGKRQKTILTEAQTWAVNKAKWNAAKNYCDSRGWEFKILTEKDLFG